MSDTIIDMAKVTQMLDAGWQVRIYKGPMGTYEVRAKHDNPERMEATKSGLIASMRNNKDFLNEMNMMPYEAVELMDFDGDEVMTDDFTPEQALTRLAYKVHGEII